MLIYDFMHNYNVFEYIIILVFLIFNLYLLSRKKIGIIDNIYFLDLTVLQSAVLGLVSFSSFLNVFLIFILFYIFIRIFFLYIITNKLNKKFMQYNIPMGLFYFFQVIYFLLSYYLIAIPSDKINLFGGNLFISSIYTLSSIMTVFYLVKGKVTLLYKMIFFAVIINTFLLMISLHSKAMLANLIFAYLFYMKYNNKKLNKIHVFGILSFVFISLMLSFGEPLLFYNRLFKNVDGLYLLLNSMGTFDGGIHSFIVQAYKVVSFKIGFEPFEIGQYIANHNNLLNYKGFGGPNDNISVYLYLYNDIGNLLLIFLYVACVVFVALYISAKIDLYKKNDLVTFFFFFVYINMPAMLQAVSTFNLIFFKFIIGFLSLFFVLILLPRKV